MKIVIVTGTPCTGKTTLAKALSKRLSYRYIDVNKVIEKEKLKESYDKKRKCYVVDVKKLNKSLIKLINNYKSMKKEINKTKKSSIKKSIKNKTLKKIKKGIIVDSHLSHYLPKKYVDLCIITKCNLKELQKRLKKKHYSKEKIRENLDCEIFDICLNEAKEAGHKVIVINTTKGLNINAISRKIK